MCLGWIHVGGLSTCSVALSQTAVHVAAVHVAAGGHLQVLHRTDEAQIG